MGRVVRARLLNNIAHYGNTLRAMLGLQIKHNFPSTGVTV